MPTDKTPPYYMNDDGTDMYDTFVLKYGYHSVITHMLMEIEQYRKRAVDKGQYVSDMEKIDVIQKRIAMMVDEMCTVDLTKLDNSGDKAEHTDQLSLQFKPSDGVK